MFVGLVGRRSVGQWLVVLIKRKEMLPVMIDVSLKTTSGVPLAIRAGVVPHITATAQRSPIKTN